ncbi:molybdate ABC transporter substrate-binding protein [Pigmentiphaga kullae]|uniref:Molybdate transport system substrate-binding protein n=1 Tax=Pigmentiphaga kullae TaxID=151784 RepID=A0A4Q7NNX4_9BURK|nr:substrate-binding domain-containing protein [Pigmentiphaga kullae]RZS86656.1 molybdate transport system substrate-binding protein [Pigmentiphaga kullae]
MRTDHQTISIFAPEAFQLALQQLAEQFRNATGITATLTLNPVAGPSADTLVNRLRAGQQPDVALLPTAALDMAPDIWSTRATAFRSPIAIAVPGSSARPDISSPERLRDVLLGVGSIAHSAAGSGAYVSGPLLNALGIREQTAHKLRLIEGRSVGQALAEGEAEIGFQQLAELLGVPGIAVLGPLPAELQKTTEIIALARETGEHWVRYLQTAEAASCMVKGGVEPPLETPPA